MEIVKVYSPIEDKGIQKNLNDSPIWTGLRYHESELTEAREKHNTLFEYLIKFDGLKPVMVNKITKL